MFSQDLGPDGNTGTSAWLYLLDLNVTKNPDVDHGLMRGLLDALKDVHLYEFVFLMLVVFNFFCGPRDNDYRYQQMREAGLKLQETFSARTCASFQHHCPGIIEDLERAGVMFPHVKDQDEECWDIWKQRHASRNKRDKVSMGRFCAFIEGMEHQMPYWKIDLWEREHMGIELDMFKSKKFCRRMIVKAADLEFPGESGTAISRIFGCGRQGHPRVRRHCFTAVLGDAYRGHAQAHVRLDPGLHFSFEKSTVGDCTGHSLRRWR